MEKWLSFIVPIYNAEQYLSECVESLLNQNFPLDKYEIILFDDGSTDNSLNIAKEYAKLYSNIRVFSHLNVGVSETRNAGLRKAVGDYIWFVDNDDCIVEKILPVLYGWTSLEKVDMLIFDSLRFRGDCYWSLPDFVVKETSVISGINAFLSFYYDPVPWNKLLRRSFVEENHLYFAQRLSEDSEWGVRCFYHAEKVKAIPVHAVYYRVLETSFSHTEANRRALVEGLLECLENHSKYMLSGHPGNIFWMRAFVQDLRRLHNVGLERVVCTRKEKKEFITRERDIVNKIICNLPVSLRVDYIILLACSISPTLILNIQSFLRMMKHIKSKIVKRV